MGLEKRNYTDKETLITAKNMNDIQDAIIELERSGTATDEHINSLIDAKLGVIADASY